MATARIFFAVVVCSSAIYVAACSHSHHDGNLDASKCSVGGPEVRSPFCLINKRPCEDNTYGHFPGYELKCSGENSTVIGFPSYGDLTVKSIDYETKRIDLIDPKSCVHEVFLNLDLTNTPFQNFYSLKNYTYLDCSSSSSSPLDPILQSYDEIPCMSGAGHKVYTVDVSIGVPSNCREIKTVAIPFGYNPYISDNTFGLALTWDWDSSSRDYGCNNPIANRHQVQGWSIFLCGLAVTGLVVVKMYHVKKQGELNNNKEMDLGFEQLLKDNEGMLQSEEA